MPLPQRIAAIPGYLPRDLKEAAPGHRFQLYLENWQALAGSEYAPYKKARPVGNEERVAYNRECAGVLKDLCALPTTSQKVLAGLRARQQSLITHHGSNGYRISTKSTAPFATGLGNEHPIENGFAFLTPYGLPYLAGSGVKGILRRAAEELALENEAQQPDQWTWVDVWHLFGFEGAVDKGSIWDGTSTLGQAFSRDLPKTAAHPDIYSLICKLFGGAKEGARFLDRENLGAQQLMQTCLAGKSMRGGLQCRGALDFWDVYPSPAGGKLVVEIMTPHYGKYYQGTESPHDSGAPVPVSFLAVPAKSDFDFSVVCQPQRLPESLKNQWRSLLDQAFAQAFEWVGFGAKTAVGYGAMATKAASPASAATVPTQTGAAGATPSTTSDALVWPVATLTLNKGSGEIKASFEGKTTAGLKGDESKRLQAALGDERAAKLVKKQELKGVAITVEQQGNSFLLRGLHAQ